MRLLTLLVLSGVAMFSASAQSQASYPNRALRIVVPTSPGSGSDTTARFFGEKLAAELGQPVLIENKAGANGVIAAMAVKQAPADGYTLFLGTNTHMAVNPIIVKDLPYDPIKDFKFVSGLARGMMIFVAPANSKYKNIGELVASARAQPGKLNVGSYTGGFQLSAEWFGGVSGTKSTYVNYRGAPEVFNAVMGEQLDFAVTDLIAALPQVKSGRLRAIAVSGEQRYPEAPDVPTLKESGYPDYVNYTWTSLLVRAETPDEISGRLQQAIKKIMATQAAKDFTAQIGSEQLLLGPEQMRGFQRKEIDRFHHIADSAGIKPQ